MILFTRICRFAVALLVAGCVGCTLRHTTPLPTVESVDLARYMGEWHEIVMLPNSFQSMCAADTQASYRMDGDLVRVRNRCRKADGGIEEADGIAKVAAALGFDRAAFRRTPQIKALD